MLARKDKRVIIVDADPQCNLTGMVLGFKHLERPDLIEGKRDGFPANIKEGLAPAFESRPEVIKPVACINTPGNENLFLLPGHVGLAENEVTLGIAQELSGSIVTLRNLPGSLRFLIDKTAGRYNADLMLIDMSPSLGAINQNLLTTSEYFIVPMNPDYFSIMAIRSLGSVLPKWKAWSDTAKGLSVFVRLNIRSPMLPPSF